MSGWTSVAFEEACIDVSGGNKKLPRSKFAESGAFPIVDQGEGEVAGFTDDSNRLFRGPTPVIVFGDHTRRFKFVDHPFAIGADGVKVLAPTDGVDPRFLFQYLRSVDLPSAGYSRHFKFLKRLDVPLPSRDEQRRITRVLDAADALRAKRREVSLALDTLPGAAFLVMFGDPVTNPKNWPRVPIGESGRVVTGNTPSREDPASEDGSIGWIKSDNLSEGATFATSPAESVSRTAARAPRVVGAGAVLVTCIAGSPSSIGNVAITGREVAFNQQISAVEPRTMKTGFLYVQLRLAKRLVQAASTGGMKGMVNKTRFGEITLIAPPRRLQEEFDERFAAIEAIKRRSTEHLAHLDALFASLQARAFSGEL